MINLPVIQNLTASLGAATTLSPAAALGLAGSAITQLATLGWIDTPSTTALRVRVAPGGRRIASLMFRPHEVNDFAFLVADRMIGAAIRMTIENDGRPQPIKIGALWIDGKGKEAVISAGVFYGVYAQDGRYVRVDVKPENEYWIQKMLAQRPSPQSREHQGPTLTSQQRLPLFRVLNRGIRQIGLTPASADAFARAGIINVGMALSHRGKRVPATALHEFEAKLPELSATAGIQLSLHMSNSRLCGWTNARGWPLLTG